MTTKDDDEENFEDEDEDLRKAISLSCQTYEEQQERKTQGLTSLEEQGNPVRRTRPNVRVSTIRWHHYQYEDADEALSKAILLSIESFQQEEERKRKAQGSSLFVEKSNPFNSAPEHSCVSSSRNVTQMARALENKCSISPCVPGRGIRREVASNDLKEQTTFGRNHGITTEGAQFAKTLEKKSVVYPRPPGGELGRNTTRRSNLANGFKGNDTLYGEPTYLTKKAMPLCLPDNLEWNPQTGEVEKRRDRRRSLYVVEAALYELRKVKEPVCVVSIVGPCRDGKSFILSEAFGQPDVFPVGHKMDPETMGIWIWILPYTIKDNCGRQLRVVLLDSEGTDDARAEGKNDNQNFSLTVLMASILIYNSKNVPKRSDLDNLDFVARLSQQIEVISNNRSRAIKNEDAFHKTFPHFIWLLRDVMTDIPDDCRDIKDYFLTRIFKEPDSSENDRTQHIAESILHFFAGFDAFCLPPPAYKKELMKDIQRNKDGMNPEFFDEVEKFRELLKSRLGPKKSCNEGEFVTGEGLATLTKLYVEAINDPCSIPNVQTAWKTYVRRKCQEAKEKALLAYDKKMKAELSKLPCESEKILASHDFATDASIRIFHEETAGITLENTRMDSEELMNEEIKKLSEWKTKNDGLTKDKCVQLLKELKQKYLDPILVRLSGPDRRSGRSVSYKEIDNACSSIENEYRMRAIGASNVRAEVLHEFHKRLSDEKEMLKKLRDYDEDLLQQRLRNAKKDKEADRLKANNEYMKKQHQIEDKELRDLEDRKRKELLIKLNQLKATQSSFREKIQNMEAAGMERQISNLKYQLGEAKKEKSRWENEIGNLRKQVARLGEELRLANRPLWKKWFGIDE